jgi:GNAT superfamily N-acetyltransferase
VGYVVGFYDEPHFMWSTGRVGHIDSFYVLPELRGRGVGRLLMEPACAEMRQAGATTVALEMVANNHLAQSSTSERALRPHSSSCTGGSALIRGLDGHTVLRARVGRCGAEERTPPSPAAERRCPRGWAATYRIGGDWQHEGCLGKVVIPEVADQSEARAVARERHGGTITLLTACRLDPGPGNRPTRSGR